MYDITRTTVTALLLLAIMACDLTSTSRMNGFIEAGKSALLQGRYTDALQHAEKGLALAEAANHLGGKARFCSLIGLSHYNLGRYQEALRYHRQALALYRELSDSKGEGNELSNIGNVYAEFGRFEDALSHYRNALVIRHSVRDRRGEAGDLANIGVLHSQLGKYTQALDYLKKALTIDREIGDRFAEGANLTNIASVYQYLGRYEETLANYQQALAISREIDDRQGIAGNENGLGTVYSYLGQHIDAINHMREALAVARDIEDRRSEGDIQANMGSVSVKLGRYEDALSHYQQALAIHHEIDNRFGEGRDLGNIGVIYYPILDDDQKATGYLTQALTISREIGDRSAEAGHLINLGMMRQSHDYLGQALIVQTELAEPEALWRIWGGFQMVIANQSRPAAAIFAGKQAINAIQVMREASSRIEQRLQQSLLNDKELVYRRLSDLLIAQDREAEAQEVLDMLKGREFYDYIQADDAQDPRTIRVHYNAIEDEWNAGYAATTAPLPELARRIETLIRIDPSARADEEKAELVRLMAERDNLTAELEHHIADLSEHFAAIDPQAQTEQNACLAAAPGNKRALLAELSKHSGTRTGLFQFILLPEHVRILLTTPEGWHSAVAEITREELNSRVDALSMALKDRTSRPQLPAKKLYDVLVAPIAEHIDTVGLKTLLVHLDGRLRYIPFAALHDGEHWLAERWSLVYHTAASERQIEAGISNWRVAGFGTTRAYPPRFSTALLAVDGELDGIIIQGENDPKGVLPGSVYLNEAFSAAVLRREAADNANSILHIATHFDLKPGDDSQSHLLLGTGETLSLRDLRLSKPPLDLRHVDLVTLSACNTAMGGADSTGVEIEGMGTIVQRQGARGVLASLWPVADTSTGKLMQTFYRLRVEHPELTKAEALQKTQIQFIKGVVEQKQSDSAKKRIGYSTEEDDLENTHDTTAPNPLYLHPYYWAPFILMGNWL